MADSKRVVVTGATGLIGRRLCQRLIEKGYEVIVFARNVEAARQRVRGAKAFVAWTPVEHGEWAQSIDGAYAVINLAGAPVFKRWTDAYKREIIASRVVGTRGLVNAALSAVQKPHILINASAVGYYGFRDDTPLDESASSGDDFLARVCVDWEAEALEAQNAGIRTVLLRTGVVLSPEEGALPQMLLPFRLFSGGPILPGTQWFSWIHLEDEIGIILLALEDERVSGPINLTAPEPQTNRDFEATLGKVYGTPSWLPVPAFGLKLLFGELADTLTTGQRVIPKKAEDLGYTFRYRTSEAALRELLGK